MGTITNFYLFEPAKKSFVICGGSTIIHAYDQEDADRIVKDLYDKASGFAKSMFKYPAVPFEEYAYRMIGGGSKRERREPVVLVTADMLKDLEETFKVTSRYRPSPSEAALQMQKETDRLQNELYGGMTKKEREAVIEPARTEPKIQRNSPCPCGSGKKYKNCCIK